MSLLSQPLFSTRVRTGITRPHLVSFPLHLQAAQRGTWNLAVRTYNYKGICWQHATCMLHGVIFGNGGTISQR